VSGLVAQMQDISLSLPRVQPMVLSTLHKVILALLPSCSWAVQHAKSAGHGAAVAQAIRQGVAVAVSDGSLCYTFGTSACVIEGMTPSYHDIAHNCVLRPVEEGDSHRCDLAGLFAIANTVNCLCYLQAVSSGTITIACDNTSALKPIAVDYLPHPWQESGAHASSLEISPRVPSSTNQGTKCQWLLR